MKKTAVLFFLFLALGIAAQDELKPVANVSVTLAGITESNTIPKSKIVKLHELSLTGADAGNYRIVSYVMAYAHEGGMTEESMDGE